MINLFHIPHCKIDTSCLGHMLHGPIVQNFEEEFAAYVGAKYACSLHSASMAIFLTFMGPWAEGINIVKIPSVIPYVVPNVLANSHTAFTFNDNICWVGRSYVLHKFNFYDNMEESFKVIDSAQQVDYQQFKIQANPKDLIIFSFYPTKPIGGVDGGMVVSDDKDKIDWFRQASMYGASQNKKTWDSWSKELEFPGWKLYMNSLQAYVASQNLFLLDAKKERLTEIREYYNKKLGYNNMSHHLYRISIDSQKHIQENFIEEMKDFGIQCGVHYHPCHLMDVYQPYVNNKIKFPLSEKEGKTTISIPFHEKLTQEEIRYIAEKINETI